MPENDQEVAQPVQACDGKNKVSESHNISIICKHRKLIPANHLKLFEVVPDVGKTGAFDIDETITIDWKGNKPKPPPPSLNLSGSATPITGPPYKIPIKELVNQKRLWECLLPNAYAVATDAANARIGVQVDKHLLKLLCTSSYQLDISIGDMPWGPLAVRVYNPDQWEVSIEIPQSGTSTIKRGWKFEKGQTVKEKTTEGDGTSEKTTTTTKGSGAGAFTKTDTEISNENENTGKTTTTSYSQTR
jgi:hypothetical protein